MKLAFYTVLLDRDDYPVKYVASPDYYVQTFAGPFGGPAKASQEFEIAVRASFGGECYYLTEYAFKGKVRAFAQMRRDDRKKLKLWTSQLRERG